MAIGILFESNEPIGNYDKIMDALEKTGTHFDGLLFHIAGETRNGFRVVDVWESEAAFNEFSKTLMPILKRMNNSAKPQMFEVHNTMVGDLSKTRLPTRAVAGQQTSASAPSPH